MDGKLISSELNLLKSMLYIRKVEEKICEIYSEQEMRCPVHISIGQEAIPVGVCSNLSKEDLVYSNHRSHAHYLAKNGDLKKFFAELYGRETGCAKGRGGSMHLIDLEEGFMCSSAIVSGTIPLAVGAGFSFQMQGKKNVAVVFMGDAAAEEGNFHESVNFAKLRELPVLFVCENNSYSVYTHLRDRQSEARKVIDIARGHGLTCYEVDGNDAAAVAKVSADAIKKIREGGGPAFIEAPTFRWREHCGPNYDDHLGYRNEAEVEEWKTKDPIKKLRDYLLTQGLVTEEQLEEIEKDMDKEINAAVDFAKTSKYPGKEELGDNVYNDA